MRRILIVEDNPHDSADLEDILRQENYDVLTARDGAQGLRLAVEKQPDLIILDWELPDTQGDRLCARLRRQNHPAMIFMLTGRRTDDIDEVRALRVKADEYMRKPYSELVLLERVERLFRQREGRLALPDALCFGDVTVDFVGYQARKDDMPVPLSATALDILRLLVSRAGTVVARDELREKLSDPGARPTRTLDNIITSLRKKLGFSSDRLRAVAKRGYAFAKADDIFVTIRGKKVCLTDI